VLGPVEHLVNGVSIVQCEAVERVAYSHVELDSHDVIVAEGAAAETFVDCDSRRMFHNAVEFAVLYPGEDAPRYRIVLYSIERLRGWVHIPCWIWADTVHVERVEANFFCQRPGS